MFTDEEVRKRTDARDRLLRAAAFEFAFEHSARRLRRLALLSEFAGVALALVLLLVLYVLGEGPWQEFAAASGTALSTIVVLMTVWRHMARWDEQIRLKRTLSRNYRDLVGELELLLTGTWNNDAYLQCRDRDVELDKQRKEPEAELASHDSRSGHRHVAKKHPKEEVTCQSCHRTWKPEFARESAVWRVIPRATCKHCGVRFRRDDT